MSQLIVSNWNLSKQRKEQVEGDDQEGNKSSHVHNQQNPSHHYHVVPMSNYEVAELTWQNGQLAMHGLGVGGLLPTTPTKPTWGRAGETLESIVHQATCQKQNHLELVQHDHQNNIPANLSSIAASSGGKWAEGSSGKVGMTVGPPGISKKRMRSDKKQLEGGGDRSACASASATFCRDNDTTIMTWPSFQSPRSLKTKTTEEEEDSACHGDGSENRDEEQETKAETGRSQSRSTRRRRAAAVHNQSERRRRDRINQKMRALQKLVPNASKTDKASMLDEVIEYLKQLQAQVQMMSVRNMPWGMLPLGMQQHIQMSLLARMGMGMGLGMGMGVLDMSAMARTASPSLPPVIHPTPLATAAAPTFVPPHFVVPPMIPAQANPNAATTTSVPFNNPYSAFLAQHSMNMELYSKMAALYQQVNQTSTQATSSPSQLNHVRGD